MSTTKLPNIFITPEPPAASDVITALNSKANANDLNNYVTLSTAQTISGSKSFTSHIDLDDSDVRIRRSFTKGTTPSELSGRYFWFGGSSTSTGYGANCLGMIANEIDTSNKCTTYMRAVKNEASSTAACSISVNVDASGNGFTYAPTPATNDNSTKIATTAFVNSRLPYTSGTWTPVLKGANTAGVFTYSTQVGYYLKIGSLVLIQAVIEVNNYTTHPVGRLSISGLPFGSAHGNYGLVIRGTGGLNNSFYRLCRCVTEHGYTSIFPQCITANSNAAEIGKIIDAYFSTSSQADGHITFATPNNDAVIGSIKIFGVYATYY